MKETELKKGAPPLAHSSTVQHCLLVLVCDHERETEKEREAIYFKTSQVDIFLAQLLLLPPPPLLLPANVSSKRKEKGERKIEDGEHSLCLTTFWHAMVLVLVLLYTQFVAITITSALLHLLFSILSFIFSIF